MDLPAMLGKPGDTTIPTIKLFSAEKVETASIELGASCSLLGAADPEAVAVTPGLSCTGRDINSLLSEMETENLS
jgi:hypothetical protein